MRIAILSDTHDNLPNFKRAISWIQSQGITTIIHCGDIASADTLYEAVKDFEGHVHVVLGNADEDTEAIEQMVRTKLPHVTLHGSWGNVELGGKKIAFVHYPDIAKDLASRGSYDIVFHGHTHKPWEETIEGCKVVNPGNVANILFKPTCAVYDTEQNAMELQLLEQL